MTTKFDYDVIIIGAGSAGYPAGMYSSRYKMKNLIIGGQPGGALATSHKVENYPGVISASGKEIMDNFKDHAINAGSEILEEMVTEVEKHESHFHITTATDNKFTCKYVILATGNNYRHLGAKGEEEMLGKGVSYCATCDGMFFKGRDIVIVGGGNTALTEALYLAEICNKVTVIHRRDTFRAENIWVEQAQKAENIDFVLNDEVEEISGKFFVEEIKLKSGNSIKADGIFVAVGSDPNTGLVTHMNPEKDNEGCLIVDARQETSIPGLYAAGDVSTNSNKFKQTIMSAAEGCLAADSIHEELLKQK
ncbi:MAG: FAD-dependent oxidoreductase [Candidatus Gracilibacteria bacterium]|nr:FAD-dependent oxidoreductase [Candidatus Gracilibacteria bacterium]